MANIIPQTLSAVTDPTGTAQPLQPGPSDSMTKPSRLASFKKAPFRFGLAVSGVVAVAAALLIRKKHRGHPAPPLGDPDVDDFTDTQQAWLSRVREIWSEHCAHSQSAENSSGRL